VSGIVSAQPPLPEIPGATVVASGFNGPQGVLVDPEGNVWVIDSGLGGDETIQIPGENGEMQDISTGMTARIVKVAPDGTQTDIAMLPSVSFPETGESSGGARLALLDGTLYATSGVWEGEADTTPPALIATIVKVDGSDLVQVADMWAFESANNPDGLILEAHPYAIAAGPDGWLWVADAGGNDLLRVDPASGEVALVAAFDGLPGGFPNPDRNNAVESDPVPTGVAFDDEGNAYVSLLSGAPFIPGNAKVLKVTPDGTVSDYATGLTTLTDLTRGPDGELYATHIGMFTETGMMPDSGAIVRIKEGTASEIVVGNLPFPTSISFDADGNAYVTVNGVGAPGSGAVVRFDALTEMAGEPIPAAE
jgi:sugar lactone lactonase YvrE